MIKLVLASLYLFYCVSSSYADTIYQWSDPWGQIQYSKIPVTGAIISELTELPETSDTTEQQKREAMVRKLQELKHNNLQRYQKAIKHETLNAQVLATKNHCKHLRNIMTDLQLYNLWQYPAFGAPFLPGYYGYLQYDLSKEINSKCR